MLRSDYDFQRKLKWIFCVKIAKIYTQPHTSLGIQFLDEENIRGNNYCLWEYGFELLNNNAKVNALITMSFIHMSIHWL